VVEKDSSPINEVNVDILGIDVGKREMHAVLLQEAVAPEVAKPL
jgi:hypothetical protein